MVKLGLVWAVGLAVAATSCAMASEWGPPPSMEATSGGMPGWGQAAISFLASWTCGKLLWNGRRIRRLKRQQQEELEQVWNQLQRHRLAIIDMYDEEVNNHYHALMQAANTIEQLETMLYKLPDKNNDDLINRREFDDYMVHYKKLHPELTDRDLPRFEDMDHDRNGHINFREWEEYQIAYGMG